jgi:hypothetical protein
MPIRFASLHFADECDGLPIELATHQPQLL